MPNEWKIVKIVDNYRVVINGGDNDGIKRDDTLEVFAVGQPVTDPDTNEVLGTLDTIKAYLRVTNVYEKMSLCENEDRKRVSMLFPLENFTQFVKNPLPIDATEISGGYDSDNKIRVGDRVRKTK